MASKKSGTGTDKQCGKERMKKIKSVDALARPIVRAAGSKWVAHIQPKQTHKWQVVVLDIQRHTQFQMPFQSYLLPYFKDLSRRSGGQGYTPLNW